MPLLTSKKKGRKDQFAFGPFLCAGMIAGLLKDMIEQAELKDKHKHLLQLEKSTIEERIDTAVPQENDGIF